MTNHSVIPSTGVYGTAWPANFNLPQGKAGKVSYAGWTVGNEGFSQQTFLGASIRSFDVTAGFGDTTSSLSISLVEDEYNKSDGTLVGFGDDVYHNGIFDKFVPPVVGSPVFFKFGKNHATIEQAWRKTFDDTYQINTLGSVNYPTYTTTGEITSIPAGHYLVERTQTLIAGVMVDQNTFIDKSSLLDVNNIARGSGHFVFGGILQSYQQNNDGGGSPVYSVSIQDPREILSNCVVIFKNYAGTTFNSKNLFNVYGFLEYDPSDSLQAILDTYPNSKLKKHIDITTGEVSYSGDDTYTQSISSPFPTIITPITGQGFSRSSEKGIPWYRVHQALNALFEYNKPLPLEYKEKGFGGVIDFRGYKYVVDFSGIPIDKIPQMYFLDFDNIDLLSLAQELCDVISHDLFVSLFPVIDHPSITWLYNYNKGRIAANDYTNIIAGIIRIDTINKSKQPQYGAIRDYLLDLQTKGVLVENKNLGYEVSNVTTDKFIVGAQEVEMYYFNNDKDRDDLQLRKVKNGLPNKFDKLQSDQWSLETSLKQQILPFYGFLGKDAVTIPRGFGAYQQILLDSSSLKVNGVGNQYIATEMELRAASISYEAWVQFLLLYSERYMSEVGDRKVFDLTIAKSIPAGTIITGLNDDSLVGREFAVDVPRCVFNSDRPYMGDDGYPASPCSPPYGYPLYYKRAEKIGIPEAGMASLANSKTRMMIDLNRATKIVDSKTKVISGIDKQLIVLSNTLNHPTTPLGEKQRKDIEKEIAALIKRRSESQIALNGATGIKAKAKDALKEKNIDFFKKIDRLSEETVKNSRKVYNFVKNVADNHLGKTFLIKIPRMCNIAYDKNITVDSSTFEIKTGPFGFKPQPVHTSLGYAISSAFYSSPEMTSLSNNLISYNNTSPFQHYLDNTSAVKYTYGALKSSYNPISEKWEFNYSPEPQGGFFNFALFNKNLSNSEAQTLTNSQLPLSTQQDLTPQDLTNFIEENGRIKCYVRYNNSQYLDFTDISKDNFCQQFLKNEIYVPDMLEELNNTTQNKLERFDSLQVANERIIKKVSDGQNPNPTPNTDDPLKKSVAFIKCDLNDKFYMPPKTVTKTLEIYGRDPQIVYTEPTTGFIKQTIGDIACNREKKAFQPRPTAYYVPSTGSATSAVFANCLDFTRYYDSATRSDVINTENSNLDNTHIYAIITIPGIVKSNVDARYLDGPYQAFNGASLKNALTCDVVRIIPDFNEPAPLGESRDYLDNQCNIVGLGSSAPIKLTPRSITNAVAVHKELTKNVILAQPEVNVGFIAPSPVYPSIVAIPLLSHERCYGPWLSSAVQDSSLSDSNQLRFSNVGGKVDFIKNENLAPWNYAGYQLMNQAGSLEAQFSNSLLLFMERGSFSMVEAPLGITLGKALKTLGPLVTSINVSIGDSIKTTVNMDLYTARFGKLQKQKEIAISQAVRQRQKIIDNQNNMIRKGLSKGSKNYMSEYSKHQSTKDMLKTHDRDLSSYEKSNTVFDKLVFSHVGEEVAGKYLLDNSDATARESTVHASTMSSRQYQEVLQHFGTEQDFAKAIDNSAVVGWNEIGTLYSDDIYNNNMPHSIKTAGSNINIGNY